MAGLPGKEQQLQTPDTAIAENGPIRTSAEREARKTKATRAAIPKDRVLRRAVAAGAGWLALFTVGVAAVGDHELGRKIMGDVVYEFPVIAAAVLTVLAARRTEGRHRVFWRILAISTLFWLAAELIWSFYELALHRDTPFPSLADVFYIGQYVFVIPAILLGFRAPVKERMWRGLLDASIIVVALGFAGYTFLIEPLFAGGPTLATVTAVAYPLFDVAILMLLFSLAFGAHRNVPLSVGIIALAFAAAATTDALYTYLTSVQAYTTGGWLDIGWEVEAVLMCIAAIAVIRHREGDATVEFFRRDFGLPLILGGTALTLAIFLLDAHDGHLRVGSTILLTFAIAALVVRLQLTAREKGTIARQLGHALREQERLAVTDGLTGLHNRRFFEEMLKIESERSLRRHRPLGLLVLDIDHFKDINDRFGHPAGDVVLQQVAARLHSVIRSSDVVARYGGEEFVVLLPETDPVDLSEMAERCRSAIAETPFEVPGRGIIGITVSVGAAGRPTHAASAQELVRAADRALYDAKELGRNRVQIGRANPDDPAVPPVLGTVVHLLEKLAEEMDARTAPVAQHSTLALLVVQLSNALGLDAAATWRAVTAARLHDIGTIVVPDAILQKPGDLSPDEWSVIREHPAQGARLVSLVPELADVAEIVHQHHERPDGRGYPDGLRIEAIRIEARILAVCDAWSAMRAERPHRAPIPADDARAELIRGAGTQFDTAVVEAFLALEGIDQLRIAAEPRA